MHFDSIFPIIYQANPEAWKRRHCAVHKPLTVTKHPPSLQSPQLLALRTLPCTPIGRIAPANRRREKVDFCETRTVSLGATHPSERAIDRSWSLQGLS